jgi:CDP-diacylglycerol---glycerol-3-phosphate 3-phosphatidyltransferase
LKGVILANIITIFRIFLVFISVYLILSHSSLWQWTTFFLIITAFALDGVDGWVARKFNESSKLGAMLDIMSDRIVENTLWVTFAVLGWLPLTFPLIALTRGFIVDGIRSVALEQGFTAFGETSMQSDKIGYFICSSKFSRIFYAVVKAVAFSFIIVSKIPNINADISLWFFIIAKLAAFIAIELCILRAFPVIFESKKLFKNEKV